MGLSELRKIIRKQADPQRAENSLWFFKTGKGEYGEGDKFLGISNPEMRKIAKDFFPNLNFSDIQKLIKSKFHEERQIALFVLTLKFQKATPKEQKQIYNFYLKHTKYINNWDLVDLSAHKIVGAYLFDKNRKILYKLAKSKNLWERRIAIVSTFYFIGQEQHKDSLAIAEILINDKHDLIHKAVGWMLREIGKRCEQEIEENFLKKHYKTMPRTMLRYAIEKFDDKKRKFYLGKI
jgi:3-methyladenine DNA glycosylase AlkD